MVVVLKSLASACLVVLLADVAAHPGEPHHERPLAEIQETADFKARTHRQLKECENSEFGRQLQERAAARRDAYLQQLRQGKGRQLSADTVLAKDHKTTGKSSTTDKTTLFGAATCTLMPEVTQGPYYVQGELIRNDIRETQTGIDLYAELQVIDTNTCQPVKDVYIDFWHCNVTGVYSGVVANGNGNSADAKNVDATFHRGLAPTDSDGVVLFTTKFPGFYSGRTTHIHVLGTSGGSVLTNKTYTGGSVRNVGQVFFDQSLLTAVYATAPYTSNTATITQNADDSIFKQEAATFDPVMNYAYINENSIVEGIFAYISIGVDMKAAKSISSAATLTASGGVMNSGNAMGGPNGPSPSSAITTTLATSAFAFAGGLAAFLLPSVL